MTRKRQHGGASGAQKAAQSMWERAGAQAGDGAGALFARLDAQDAQDTHNPQDIHGPQDTRDGQTPPTARASAPGHPRERAAHSLERLAELIRAGVWSAELAALVAAADDLLERRERGAR